MLEKEEEEEKKGEEGKEREWSRKRRLVCRDKVIEGYRDNENGNERYC